MKRSFLLIVLVSILLFSKISFVKGEENEVNEVEKEEKINAGENEDGGKNERLG